MSGPRIPKNELFERLESFLVSHGAIRVSVFGSYARGEEDENSDLDVLVTFKETKSLFEFVRLELDLSDLLGVKVDLLSEGAISPHIRKSVQRDLKVIHG